MRSEVVLVASGDRLPRIQCSGGIQARCTALHTVHLVSAAATPLGGDTIDIRVIVEAGARLKVRSAAATVALPGASTPTSHACWDIEVSGYLDIDLEPTIVAGTARHVSTVALSLRDDCRVRLRERVQIGRCQEREGFWSGSLHADCGDRPRRRSRGARSKCRNRPTPRSQTCEPFPSFAARRRRRSCRARRAASSRGAPEGPNPHLPAR